MEKGIQTIVFDCGGVITLEQNRALLGRMAAFFGAETAEFEKAYHAERREYDRGTEDARAYWSRLGARYGRILSDADLAWIATVDMDSWFTINRETIAIVRDLKDRGFKLLILSNMNFEGKKRLEGPARFLDGKDWYSLFDDVLLSCDLGLMKPERAIFEACAARAGGEPGSCLFIDDMETNVLGARDAGMQAIRFLGADALRLALSRDYGIQ
ncbi:MAG TPA: HAD family phosphatase [Rectinemataceae bacterium]